MVAEVKPFRIPEGAIVRGVKLSALPPEASESELEVAFANAWMIASRAEPLPPFVRQYVFEADRKHGRPLDFAWPAYRLGVEIQGGTFKANRGAHSRGRGQSRDFDKLNAAILLGWRILQFDTLAIEPKRIMQTIYFTRDVLKAIAAERCIHCGNTPGVIAC